MKQLLIVKSDKAYNAGTATPFNLALLQPGAIVMHELGASTVLSSGTAPTKDFAIALGRPNNSPVFLIPEVNIDTLEVSVAEPKAGVAFVGSTSISSVAEGKVYTIVLVKQGTVPHERNTWTATHTATASDTANTVAEKLRNYFAEMAKTGSLNVTVAGTNATIQITGNTVGEGWVMKVADDLSGATVNTTVAQKQIGDKAYIQDLASRCAAGKGFTDTYANGDSIYPGYPEAVEDLTPNTSGTGGASTAGYSVITLRFAVPRKSAKTRDEVVNQLVHIAIPITNASYSGIKTMLTGASKFLTKSAADAAYAAKSN